MQQGLTEELYAHVAEYRERPEYSDREKLAIEFAERFIVDHLSMDDAFFSRMRAHFADEEGVGVLNKIISRQRADGKTIMDVGDVITQSIKTQTAVEPLGKEVIPLCVAL